MTPFDRKKAVMDGIEGMSKALNAVRKVRQTSEAEVAKWQDSLDATLLIERYAQEELRQMVQLKQQIEQEEKIGG